MWQIESGRQIELKDRCDSGAKGTGKMYVRKGKRQQNVQNGMYKR